MSISQNPCSLILIFKSLERNIALTDRAKSTECSLFLQITKRESIPVEKMLSRSPNIHIRENSPQLYKIPPAKSRGPKPLSTRSRSEKAQLISLRQPFEDASNSQRFHRKIYLSWLSLLSLLSSHTVSRYIHLPKTWPPSLPCLKEP